MGALMCADGCDGCSAECSACTAGCFDCAGCDSRRPDENIADLGRRAVALADALRLQAYDAREPRTEVGR